jgi:hypothetical protein
MVPGIVTYGSLAGETEARYADVLSRLEAAGAALDPSVPLIANHPMWVSEVGRRPALAIPNETVAGIVDLATTFGAEIVLLDSEHGGWPDRLATDPDAACLEEIALPPPGPGAPAGADEMRAFRVACP